jgi:hypothetical protein
LVIFAVTASIATSAVQLPNVRPLPSVFVLRQDEAIDIFMPRTGAPVMRRVLRGAWRKALIDVNATLVLARRRGGPAALSSVIRNGL